MALVTTKTVSVFDTSLVERGDLLFVQHSGWKAPKKGIVMSASESKLVVLYLTEIPNVTNLQDILASDAAEGKYTVRWSSDLVTVNEYVPEDPDVSEEPEEGENDGP